MLCLLLLLLLGVGWALTEPLLVCLLSFFLGHLQFSATCHAAGYPSGVPHLADSGWLTYSCGDGLAWGWGCLSTDVLLTPWVSTLCLHSFPFGVLQSCRCVSMSGSSLLQPNPGVGLEGSLLCHLVFSHVPCSSSRPVACAVFPAAGSLRVFWSPGVCPSASLVTRVGLSPSLLFMGFSCSACLLG